MSLQHTERARADLVPFFRQYRRSWLASFDDFDLSELGKTVIDGPDAVLNRVFGPPLQQIYMAKTVVLACPTYEGTAEEIVP
jgi:hypothetical protein